MGHGKPLGSFGQGTDFYGEGEMVSLVGNLQDFFYGSCLHKTRGLARQDFYLDCQRCMGRHKGQKLD